MKRNIIILLLSSLIIVSCKSKQEPKTDSDQGLIEITKAQFDSEKMVLGEPLLKPFVDAVHVTGIIIPSLNGHALISIPISGSIKQIYCKQGQKISKGSAMFDIAGNEFIDLQKEIAESSAIVSRLKADYLRIKELYTDKVAAQKDFISAESNYLAENAKYMSLKIKLESMGLDAAKIEKGEFYSTYTIKSPINGFVSGIQAAIGQYIDPQQNIAEVIDDKSFQLKLSVFEKNIYKVKTGQTVAFYLNGNKSTDYKATINTVGKNIIPDSKSIDCYAEIENLQSINIVGNQFIEGQIYTSIDSVLSVPESAIINSETDLYLLFFEKEVNSIYYFKKINVKTGRKANGYIELTEQLPANKLLIGGVYNIQVE